MVRSEIEYLGQIKFPDTILIGTGISKVGNSNLDAFQGIYNAESKKLLSVAKTTGVWFDVKNQKPVRLPKIKDLDAMMLKSESNG